MDGMKSTGCWRFYDLRVEVKPCTGGISGTIGGDRGAIL
jgi:hypothetical protein